MATLTCSVCGREYTFRGYLRGAGKPGSLTICPDCAKPLTAYYWDRLKTKPLAVLLQAAALIAVMAFLTWPIWSGVFHGKAVITDGCGAGAQAEVCPPLRSN
jgi:hypothetical protein